MKSIKRVWPGSTVERWIVTAEGGHQVWFPTADAARRAADSVRSGGPTAENLSAVTYAAIAFARMLENGTDEDAVESLLRLRKAEREGGKS